MKGKIAIYALVLSCCILTGCTQSNDSEQNSLSEEDAKTIALEHAGLGLENVTFTKTKVERDNSQDYYDVEFYTRDGMEYGYEIDKYTGKILEWDSEIEGR